jgi:hypothetical protein
LRDFILYYKVLEFSEFCKLLVHYGYQEVIGALKCVSFIDDNNRYHYERIIEKIRQRSELEFPIKGEDLIKLGIAQGEQLGKEIENLKIIFLQTGNIEKSYYLDVINKNPLYIKERG